MAIQFEACLLFLFVQFDELDGSQLNKLKADLFEKYDKKKYPGDVIVQPDVTYQACPTLNDEGIMSYNIKEHYVSNSHFNVKGSGVWPLTDAFVPPEPNII